ncbi:replication-relaxation family protein [Lysinibacillus sphaericus]
MVKNVIRILLLSCMVMSSLPNKESSNRNGNDRTIFYSENGTVPFWDHPNFLTRAVIPDEYQPITRVEHAIELSNQNILTEDALRVLKVVGDALCANESQIKRYMKRYNEKFGTSHTSRILRKLAKYALVERYDCRIAYLEDDGSDYPKRPAPFTLGIGGVKFLQHFYPDMHFVRPETWRQSHATVQRYVAVNEFRCQAAQSGNLLEWRWHPHIGNHTNITVPLAVARVKNTQHSGDIQIIMERAQSSQHFVNHIKQRLDLYNSLIRKDQKIIIDQMERTAPQIVIISCGTLEMAKRLNVQLELDKYQFNIWFVMDEWIEDSYGLAGAFARPIKKGTESTLERFKFPVFTTNN